MLYLGTFLGFFFLSFCKLVQLFSSQRGLTDAFMLQSYFHVLVDFWEFQNKYIFCKWFVLIEYGLILSLLIASQKYEVFMK